MILIGRSREGTFERREHWFAVWRVREHEGDKRPGDRGIRRGKGTEGVH